MYQGYSFINYPDIWRKKQIINFPEFCIKLFPQLPKFRNGESSRKDWERKETP